MTIEREPIEAGDRSDPYAFSATNWSQLRMRFGPRSTTKINVDIP